MSFHLSSTLRGGAVDGVVCHKDTDVQDGDAADDGRDEMHGTRYTGRDTLDELRSTETNTMTAREPVGACGARAAHDAYVNV